MDEATAKNAIDWLLEASGAFNGELKVNFMGGEPLLRFDLIRKIVPYGKCRARQLGKSLHFGCTTNCTHLTDEIMSFWRRFGMGFHCSIDGIPEVQNANRPFLGGGPSAPAVEKIVPEDPGLSARGDGPRDCFAAVCTFTCRERQVHRRAGFSLDDVQGGGELQLAFRGLPSAAWAGPETRRGPYRCAGLAEATEHFRVRQRHPLHPFVRGPLALPLRGRARGGVGRSPGRFLALPSLWAAPVWRPVLPWETGRAVQRPAALVFLRDNVLEDAKTDCAHCPAVLSCRSWCYAECVDSTRTLYDPGAEYRQAVRTSSGRLSASTIT